jgi:hypothetical protein
MSDIRCPKCLEPWDNDSLHEAVDEGLFPNYDAAAKAFRKDGCAAIGGRHNQVDPESAGARATVSMIYDLLGDDMDGAMSEMDDAEMMGLL